MTQFEPVVSDSPAEVAETLRMPLAREAEDILTVSRETNSTFIVLDSGWWGNEKTGYWTNAFFVTPATLSDSGKALRADRGITARDVTRKLRSARRMRSSRGGWTENAARKTERKAFEWDYDAAFGPGAPPSDDRETFTDMTWFPVSVITHAVRAPASEDYLLVDAEGTRKGALDEADVTVTGTTHTRYGTKATFGGDTYTAFKQTEVTTDDGKTTNIGDALWDDAHATFNGDCWMADVDALELVVDTLADAGFTVGFEHEKLGEGYEASADEAEDEGAFGSSPSMC